MEVKAKVKYLRMAPRKVRLLADLIRGMKVQKALDQLQFNSKHASMPVTKLVNSAIANAVNNFGLSKDNLIVKAITVDGGPTLKRWMPRAQGRATPLKKRTSHVSITLGEIKDSGIVEGKKQKIEAPLKLGEKETEKTGDSKETAVKGTGVADKKETGSKKGFASKVFRRKAG